MLGTRLADGAAVGGRRWGTRTKLATVRAWGGDENNRTVLAHLPRGEARQSMN